MAASSRSCSASSAAPSSADSRDRCDIQKALASLASTTGANKNEVVTAVAGVLMGSGVAFYGIALVVATIFVRRFAQATLEETCRVWGARRRMAASAARRRRESETACESSGRDALGDGQA